MKETAEQPFRVGDLVIGRSRPTAPLFRKGVFKISKIWNDGDPDGGVNRWMISLSKGDDPDNQGGQGCTRASGYKLFDETKVPANVNLYNWNGQG